MDWIFAIVKLVANGPMVVLDLLLYFDKGDSQCTTIMYVHSNTSKAILIIMLLCLLYRYMQAKQQIAE